jgi:hypothetical protein
MRALKTAKAAGFDVAEVAVNADGFRLIFRNGTAEPASNDNDAAANEWDVLYAEKRSA